MTFTEIAINGYFRSRGYEAVFQKTGEDSAVLAYDRTYGTWTALDFTDHCQPCKMIAPSEIKFRRGEGRRTWSSFADLIKSVKAVGVVQPITLSYDGYLIDGWYRYQAAVAAELEFVPVIYMEKH